jgi:small subunit ribosomal protein S5
MAYQNKREQSPYTEKLIKINRVTKVTKGGKNLAFRAFVIIGDQAGTIGLATAKSKEVPLAIRRSIEKAKKSLHKINIENGTIPHKIVGEFKASKVIIRPAPEGTGVIAGGAIRVLLELLGLQNVVAKSIGSNNPLNMAKAALNGLLALKNKETVEAIRGVTISTKKVIAG